MQSPPHTIDLQPEPPPLPGAPCLVVLVGLVGAGKSALARRLFAPHEVISAHALRTQLAGDPEHGSARGPATEVARLMARARLELGQRAVVDATHLDTERRRAWVQIARDLEVPAVAIWCDTPPAECVARAVADRPLHPRTLRRWLQTLERLPRQLTTEGWDLLMRVEGATTGAPRYETLFARRAQSRRAGRHGLRHPAERLDIIGDVHGCLGELLALLAELGWREEGGAWSHPDDRLLVFAGDLTDRGPDSLGVLRLVSALVSQRRAVLVLGNHDDKLLRHLSGRKVNQNGSIRSTLAELRALDPGARAEVEVMTRALLRDAPLYAMFDRDPTRRTDEHPERLVVVHASFAPHLHALNPDAARALCLYGPTTGRKDEDGFPERVDWLADYPEDAPRVVCGHTPFRATPRWRNGIMCLDTGCVFGGALTALRWPEDTLVSVPAAQTWCAAEHLGPEPRRVSRPAPDQHDEALTELLERWRVHGRV